MKEVLAQGKNTEKDILIELYWHQFLTTSEICKIIGFKHQASVSQLLKKFGIKSRTAGEAKHIMQHDNRALAFEQYHYESFENKNQNDIIVGSLLGDGWINKNHGKNNCLFSKKQEIFKKDYLDWMAEQMGCFFKEVRPLTAVTRAKNINNIVVHHNCDAYLSAYCLDTFKHPIFTALEKKWYARDSSSDYVYNTKGQRIKIIPKDLVLSPLSFAVWLADDGSLVKHRVEICTDSFTQKEVKFLTDVIKRDLNINSTISKRNRIYISAKEYSKVIGFILPYFQQWPSLYYKIGKGTYKDIKRNHSCHPEQRFSG